MYQVDAFEVIEATLKANAGSPPAAMAQHIRNALVYAGVVVLNPQDLEWGACPERTIEWDDNGGHEVPAGPHAISTSLCVYCLQYDPE